MRGSWLVEELRWWKDEGCIHVGIADVLCRFANHGQRTVLSSIDAVTELRQCFGRQSEEFYYDSLHVSNVVSTSRINSRVSDLYRNTKDLFERHNEQLLMGLGGLSQGRVGLELRRLKIQRGKHLREGGAMRARDASELCSVYNQVRAQCEYAGLH